MLENTQITQACVRFPMFFHYWQSKNPISENQNHFIPTNIPLQTADPFSKHFKTPHKKGRLKFQVAAPPYKHTSIYGEKIPTLRLGKYLSNINRLDFGSLLLLLHPTTPNKRTNSKEVGKNQKGDQLLRGRQR